MFRLVSSLLSRRPISSARRHRLRVELLEDRCVPATLFVDPNVAATAQIFPTIAAAVNGAHANDTIRVVAGTYHESVTVNKPGLTILGNQVRVAG
jgi:hypothetical protein